MPGLGRLPSLALHHTTPGLLQGGLPMCVLGLHDLCTKSRRDKGKRCYPTGLRRLLDFFKMGCSQEQWRML